MPKAPTSRGSSSCVWNVVLSKGQARASSRARAGHPAVRGSSVVSSRAPLPPVDRSPRRSLQHLHIGDLAIAFNRKTAVTVPWALIASLPTAFDRRYVTSSFARPDTGALSALACRVCPSKAQGHRPSRPGRHPIHLARPHPLLWPSRKARAFHLSVRIVEREPTVLDLQSRVGIMTLGPQFPLMV
jgi:hypothetical protein